MCEISDEEIMRSMYKSVLERKKIELDSRKRNKLSDYFFSASNTLLGSLVVGIILLVLGDDTSRLDTWIVFSVFILGVSAVIILVKIGYNILK